jgi:hypothetical protein
MATALDRAPLDLHAAGQRAERYGQYDLAAQLYLEAARCAMTPTGAQVLLEMAAKAQERAVMRPRYYA